MDSDFDKRLHAVMVSVPTHLKDLPAIKPNRCILATALGGAVLDYFGILWRAVAVNAYVVNRRWIEWAEAGASGRRPDDAWSIGVDDREDRRAEWPPGGWWSGHLVLEIRKHGEPWWLDLDAQQFRREAHGIRIPDDALACPVGSCPPPLKSFTRVLGAPDPGDLATACIELPGPPTRNGFLTGPGAVLWWIERPGDTSYRRARDWRERGKVRRELVTSAISLAKSALSWEIV